MGQTSSPAPLTSLTWTNTKKLNAAAQLAAVQWQDETLASNMNLNTFSFNASGPEVYWQVVTQCDSVSSTFS